MINYKKVFVDNPSNQYEVQKDSNIQQEMRTEEFQRVFLMLLISRYTDFVQNGSIDYDPPGVIAAKENWIGHSSELNFISIFSNEFEITNDATDFTMSSEIDAWIISKDLGISYQKFSNELKKHCVLQNLDNVKIKDKKLNGKGMKAWFGIKKIPISLFGK